jgi:hypothetical protein
MCKSLTPDNDPIGVVVLASDRSTLAKVQSGTGMLLRIGEIPNKGFRLLS